MVRPRDYKRDIAKKCLEELLMILLDTNILIELFKAKPVFITEIRKIGIENITISKISVFEMFIGALNKKELKDIKTFLDKFSQISINPYIVDQAVIGISVQIKSFSIYK